METLRLYVSQGKGHDDDDDNDKFCVKESKVPGRLIFFNLINPAGI